jgi:hypothetical protein
MVWLGEGRAAVSLLLRVELELTASAAVELQLSRRRWTRWGMEVLPLLRCWMRRMCRPFFDGETSALGTAASY